MEASFRSTAVSHIPMARLIDRCDGASRLRFQFGGIAVIIPLNHENMQGRRWPYVTIGIIALNAIAFLATHSTIDRETKEMGEVREHILLLAAAHRDTPLNATEQKLVENFRHSQAKTWDLLASRDH